MVALRPYQARGTDEAVEHLNNGHNTVLVAPTGSGKTVMGASVIDKSCRGSVLWIAHRDTLLTQAKEANEENFRRGTRIYYDTAQSSCLPGSKEELRPGLIVWDECHHAVADDWSRVLDKYPGIPVLGLTATPTRQDGRALDGMFSRLVVAAQYSELLAAGNIAPCECYAAPPSDKPGLTHDPVLAWQKWGVAPGFGFAPSVALAQEWAERTTRASWVAGILSQDEIARRIQLLRDGEIDLLWSVQLLTEGVDVAAAKTCLIARSVGSAGQYLQMAGRVLRTHPSKATARLVDLSGAVYRYGPPDIDREYSLEGEPIRTKERVPRYRQCPACGAVEPSHVRECSRCSYVTPMHQMPVRIHSEELALVYDGQATAADVQRRELRRILEEHRKHGPANLRKVASVFRGLFGRTPDMRGAVTAAECAGLRKQFEREAAARGFAQGWVYGRMRGYGL